MNGHEGQEENENSRFQEMKQMLGFEVQKQKKNRALYSAMKAETK